MKFRYLFSNMFQSLNEYQQAEKYISTNRYPQAFEMLQKVIKIVKPYEMPRQLLTISYSVAKQLGPQEQNEILSFDLKPVGNLLQFLKNQLFLDPRQSLKYIEKYEGLFLDEQMMYDFKRIELFTHLSVGVPEIDQTIMDLLKYSEQPIQKQQTLLDISLAKWLALTKQFTPSKLYYPLPSDQAQYVLDHFSNAEAKLSKFPPAKVMKFYKSYQDFIISANIQQFNKTIVGLALNNFLKYAEKKAPNQIYKPLLGLGWLQLMDGKVLASEGLLRNVEDQLKAAPKTIENQIYHVQLNLLMSKLLQKIDKRQSESDQYLKQARHFPIPFYCQLATLYFDIEDFPVKF